MPVAETLAVVASIVAIVQISDRVIGSCKFYMQAASDTPSELRAILVEVSTLKSVLESLQFFETCDHAAPALWKQLSGQDGPIEECRRSISALEKLFPADQIPVGGSQSVSKKRKVQILHASLAWPLKARRARELLQIIIQQKTMINLALTTEAGQEIKSIKKDTAEIRDMLTESERREIYRWLERTDPSPIHNRSWKLHEPETSSWILRSPEWSKWLAGDVRCLWIHGIPGAGKTILASFLVEQLKTHCKHPDRNGRASYYCYFGHNQDEASPFLTWTIAQLCRQSNSLPSRVYELYKQGGQPSLAELLSALEASLQSFDTAHIILDAADESILREDLLRVLRDLATDPRFSKICCLVTSRRYIDIEQALEPVSHSIPMYNTLVDEDIRKHVQSMLYSKSKFQHWPSDLLIDVEEAVVNGSKGMFRWAVCQLQCLQRLKPERQIIGKALATLPKTLDETYERILMDIPRDEWPFTRHALRWVCFHQALYKTEDAISLQILLAATELTTCREAHQESEFEYDAERLRSMLGCLVNVDEEGLVFLAHYTVKEYLESPRLSQAATAYFWTGQESIKKDCMQTILREAQAISLPGNKRWLPIEEDVSKDIEDDDSDDIGDDDNRQTPREFFQEFDVYCVVSSAMLLQTKQVIVASNELLLSLAANFVNPTLSHFDDSISIYNHFQEGCGFFYRQIEGIGTGPLPYWLARPECVDAGILLQFLLYSSYSDLPVLAAAFLEGKVVDDIVQSNVKFMMEIHHGLPSWCRETICTFDGSLLEVLAQLHELDSGSLSWLLDQCETAMDEGVLLAVVAFHTKFPLEEHEDRCLLKKVLSRQADLNATGHSITPLQIAVAVTDTKTVTELLEAGADPNAIGNPTGLSFKTDSILACFNQLQGLHPLYICRHFVGSASDMDDRRHSKERDTEARVVEALLLQYGARDDAGRSEPLR